MIRLALFIFLAVFTTSLSAQTAHLLSMGNTKAARTDVHALFGNQAGLASLKNSNLLISTERRFNLNELSSHTAGAAFVTNAGTFGLAINYFGFSEYNEQKIGLAYARKLGQKFSVGAQVDYLGTRIKEYGNVTTYTFELGILANINSKLNLGAHIFNPVNADRGIEEEPLETIFSLGLSYRASEKFTIMADAEAEFDFDLNYKLGIDYTLNEMLHLRFGAFTEPVTLTFGLGLQIKSQLYIDFASSYQTILGLTPGIGVRYAFNSKK